MEEEARAALIEQIAGIITSDGGEVEDRRMGHEKLAYPIDDLNDGYYVLVDFQGQARAPRELERKMQISDSSCATWLRSRTYKRQ